MIILALGILLFSVGPVGNLFLCDPDVGWLFSFMGLAQIVLLFTVVQEIRNNLSLVSEYLRLGERDFRWIVERKLRELKGIVDDTSSGKVHLGLDDLFETVTYLVSTCRTLEAVDIRSERWDSDVRAIKYLEGCRRAAARGAKITRIFVLEDGVLEEKAEELRAQLERQREAGVQSVLVVFKSQVPPTYIRDFGIFDGSAVLDEDFDANGDSLYRGFFSKNRSDVREYDEIFQLLKREATKNQQQVADLLGELHRAGTPP